MAIKPLLREYQRVTQLVNDVQPLQRHGVETNGDLISLGRGDVSLFLH